MFNYLLYTLKKDGVVLTTPNFQQSMQYLLLYVYDYNKDPFVLSMKLLKKGYLNYYFEEIIDEEYLEEGEAIVSGLRKVIHIFKASREHFSQHNSAQSNSQLNLEAKEKPIIPVLRLKND